MTQRSAAESSWGQDEPSGVRAAPMRIYVPANILADELTDEASGYVAHPANWRLLVSLCVLHREGRTGAETMRAARQLWPAATLNRPGRVTVLAVLFELEALGACTDIRPEGDGFTVTPLERAQGVA